MTIDIVRIIEIGVDYTFLEKLLWARSITNPFLQLNSTTVL